MSAVGDRKGLLICTSVDAPEFPSRWCRWIGHDWTGRQTSAGGVVRDKYQTCQRCGAEESWHHFRRLPEWYEDSELDGAR